MNPLELNGDAFLLFYSAVMACAFYGAYRLRQMMLSKDANPEITAEATASALDPYEAAYLIGGIRRVIATLCATLIKHGVLTFTSTNRAISIAAPVEHTEFYPVEQDLLRYLKVTGGAEPLARVQRAMLGLEEPLHKSLVTKGLATDSSLKKKAGLLPCLCVVTVALGIAIPKIWMEITAGMPFVFTAVLAALACIVSLAFLMKNDKTAKGQEVAKALLKSNSGLLSDPDGNPKNLNMKDTGMAFAIYGTNAMTDDLFKEIDSGIGLQVGAGYEPGWTSSGADDTARLYDVRRWGADGALFFPKSKGDDGAPPYDQ